MTDIATARSLLFVPGTRPDRFAKAAASGADGIICDLEDAVAPADKDSARQLVIDGIADVPGIVRINAVGTEWHEADLDAVVSTPTVVGVMLPKAEDPGTVARIVDRLNGTPLVLLVESALGIEQAGAIARVPGVARLCFGNLDFSLDAGITVRTPDENELLYARSRLVVASRAAGLPGPIDGVVPNINDDELLARRSARALDLGYTAKLCIHPRQIPIVHQAFAPAPDEVAWAQRVVDAAGETQGAAVQLDGQMIDRPVLLRAQSILARQ